MTGHNIRALTERDIPACLQLADARRWPPSREHWELLLHLGDGYAVPAKGRLAATVTAVVHDGVCALGMLLVDPEVERQGLGEALMRHAMSRADVNGFVLSATDFGQRLYERLGFREVGRMLSLRGTPSQLPEPGAVGVRAARDADLPAMTALDEHAVGRCREGLVTALPSLCSQLLVTEDGEGFGGRWWIGDRHAIGPIVARTPEAAWSLLSALVTGAHQEGGAMVINLREGHDEHARRLEHIGLEVRSDSAWMTWGAVPQGDTSARICPISQAIG